MLDHGGAVLRVCRALLGAQEAEDAWSETFLAALAAYPQLRPDSNVRGWLVTIAHHKSIDTLRRGGRVVIVPAVPEAAVLDGEPADEVLWAAVANLPPKQRGAVAYHYIADLPYAQVGQLLGTNESAARRSAADGIAALRKILEPGATP